MRRFWPLIGVVLVGSAGVVWGAARVAANWRFASGLEWSRGKVSAGQFHEAREWLSRLGPPQSNNPEAAYWLGVCEHAEGRYDAALEAWSRVALEGPFGVRAALARARTLVGDCGRFADAEVILEQAARLQDPLRVEVGHTLGQLYFWESRRDAMRRLILARWTESRRPAAELRDLWQIDDSTTLMEEVRSEVEAGGRKAPNDDRVWLARAGLATEMGRLDEARKWLDSCLARRPDDPAVWCARLRWARAAADAGEAETAANHLDANALILSEALELRAWFAAHRGDATDERKSLEQLVALEPGQTRALERLAVLASDVGDASRAEAFRRRKATIDEAKDRYRRLLADAPPTRGFFELARLAETLGRPVEAKGWCLLAARYEPENPEVAPTLARLQIGRAPAPSAATGTLTKRLASLFPNTASASPERTASASRTKADVITPDFHDEAAAAGLSFRFENGRSPQRQLPETTAGGVALLDYDGDGWLDVYVVQGGVFPPDRSRPSTGDRLFRNRRDGTFEDATERAGVAAFTRGYGHGVAVGDFDNDGRPDLFVTRWRCYALYRNRGDGTFEDVTERAGLGGDRDWPTSAAFADLDNDGDLDLYVCHYLQWDAEHPQLCPQAPPSGEGVPPQSGTYYGYCMPHPFPALPDHLFRNDGGRFVDVTDEAGIVDRDGRGLGVVAADFDDDGKVDLFVANDTTANYLFHNLGAMKFEEVGIAAGVACNAGGAFQAGMGTACGDLDGDGRLDLAVTNFYGESTTFFRNLGRLSFSDETAAVGLGAASRFLLGFGITFFDANNDGRLDLATANGHVNEDTPRFPYEMPAQLLVGTPEGRLRDVSEHAGEPWRVPRVGRGLAVGDLDNDGRRDLLLLAQKSPLAYFHNRTALAHSLTIRLEGTVSNRDGVGARVLVTSGGRRQAATRYGGGSFQSTSDPRLHFGLAGNTKVEQIEVRWPSGRIDTYRDVLADAGYLLREGESAPRLLPGFREPQASGPPNTR